MKVNRSFIIESSVFDPPNVHVLLSFTSFGPLIYYKIISII